MKKYVLFLLGFFIIVFPVVLFAQTPITSPAVDTPITHPMVGGCMTVTPEYRLECVFNLVKDLNKKIDNLESRIKLLESKTVVTPTPTVPLCPAYCDCSKEVRICRQDVPPVPVPSPVKPIEVPVACPVGDDSCDKVIISPIETKIIQNFLKEEGSFNYPTATGYYGSLTKEAVKNFQKKQGLTATGLVDKKTLNQMKAIAPNIAPSIEQSLQSVN